MKLNRKWLMVIALVMSLTMATAGTLAYLTDKDTEVNTFTMGNVDIEVEEEFEQDSELYPGVKVDKLAGIKNIHATEPAYVWMTVSVPEELADYVDLGWSSEAEVEPVTSVHEGYVSYLVKHEDELKPGRSTPMYLESVTLSDNVDYQDGKYVVIKDGEITATLDSLDDIKVVVDGFAIQTKGFRNFGEAYDAYAGQWAGLKGYEIDRVVTSNEELLAAIQDKNVVSITVDGDLTYDWGSTSYANSKALLMAGKTFTGADEDASLTFKGYGSANPIKDVTLRNITINDETVGDSENAWEHGHLEFEGLTAKNVVFADSIMLNGECVLDNCTVDNQVASWYGAWVEGGSTTFENCTFVGTRAIKIHEAYGTEVDSVVVDGCTFELSEKPGVVIGDVNSETYITIKDSTFDTKAGDQGEYIYESDTDVTTFYFDSNNNKITATVS